MQKARVTALVYPGMHAIENRMAMYYATRHALPGAADLSEIVGDADTAYYNVSLPGSALVITIDSPGIDSKLSRLDDYVLIATPSTEGGKITGWVLSGTLAVKLGLTGN